MMEAEGECNECEEGIGSLSMKIGSYLRDGKWSATLELLEQGSNSAQTAILCEMSHFLSYSTEQCLMGFPTHKYLSTLLNIIEDSNQCATELQETSSPISDTKSPFPFYELLSVVYKNEDAGKELRGSISDLCHPKPERCITEPDVDMSDSLTNKMILAVTCMGTIIDIFPHTARYFAMKPQGLSALCNRLSDISYIDLGERILYVLIKLSREIPLSLLKSNCMVPMLMYLDFYSLDLQEQILMAIKSMIQGVRRSETFSNFVIPVVPYLVKGLESGSARVRRHCCSLVYLLVESGHAIKSGESIPLVIGALGDDGLASIFSLIRDEGDSSLFTESVATLTTLVRYSDEVLDEVIRRGFLDLVDFSASYSKSWLVWKSFLDFANQVLRRRDYFANNIDILSFMLENRFSPPKLLRVYDGSLSEEIRQVILEVMKKELDLVRTLMDDLGVERDRFANFLSQVPVKRLRSILWFESKVGNQERVRFSQRFIKNLDWFGEDGCTDLVVDILEELGNRELELREIYESPNFDTFVNAGEQGISDLVCRVARGDGRLLGNLWKAALQVLECELERANQLTGERVSLVNEVGLEASSQASQPSQPNGAQQEGNAPKGQYNQQGDSADQQGGEMENQPKSTLDSSPTSQNGPSPTSQSGPSPPDRPFYIGLFTREFKLKLVHLPDQGSALQPIYLYMLPLAHLYKLETHLLKHCNQHLDGNATSLGNSANSANSGNSASSGRKRAKTDLDPIYTNIALYIGSVHVSTNLTIYEALCRFDYRSGNLWNRCHTVRYRTAGEGEDQVYRKAIRVVSEPTSEANNESPRTSNESARTSCERSELAGERVNQTNNQSNNESDRTSCETGEREPTCCSQLAGEPSEACQLAYQLGQQVNQVGDAGNCADCGSVHSQPILANSEFPTAHSGCQYDLPSAVPKRLLTHLSRSRFILTGEGEGRFSALETPYLDLISTNLPANEQRTPNNQLTESDRMRLVSEPQITANEQRTPNKELERVNQSNESDRTSDELPSQLVGEPANKPTEPGESGPGPCSAAHQ